MRYIPALFVALLMLCSIGCEEAPVIARELGPAAKRAAEKVGQTVEHSLGEATLVAEHAPLRFPPRLPETGSRPEEYPLGLTHHDLEVAKEVGEEVGKKAGEMVLDTLLH